MPRRPAHINLASTGARTLFGGDRRTATWTYVGSLEELRLALDAMPSRDDVATLDLIGHSVKAGQLLRLGASVIDMLDPAIEAFFRKLAGSGVLSRLHITTLRLLACHSAVQPTAQRTIKRLASVLEVRVFGATKSLGRTHYDEVGFDPTFDHLLIDDSRLPKQLDRSRTLTMSISPIRARVLIPWSVMPGEEIKLSPTLR
jgi:hypothetical protein